MRLASHAGSWIGKKHGQGTLWPEEFNPSTSYFLGDSISWIVIDTSLKQMIVSFITFPGLSLFIGNLWMNFLKTFCGRGSFLWNRRVNVEGFVLSWAGKFDCNNIVFVFVRNLSWRAILWSSKCHTGNQGRWTPTNGQKAITPWKVDYIVKKKGDEIGKDCRIRDFSWFRRKFTGLKF